MHWLRLGRLLPLRESCGCRIRKQALLLGTFVGKRSGTCCGRRLPFPAMRKSRAAIVLAGRRRCFSPRLRRPGPEFAPGPRKPIGLGLDEQVREGGSTSRRFGSGGPLPGARSCAEHSSRSLPGVPPGLGALRRQRSWRQLERTESKYAAVRLERPDGDCWIRPALAGSGRRGGSAALAGCATIAPESGSRRPGSPADAVET